MFTVNTRPLCFFEYFALPVTSSRSIFPKTLHELPVQFEQRCMERLYAPTERGCSFCCCVLIPLDILVLVDRRGVRGRPGILDPGFCFSLYYLGQATPINFGLVGLALGLTWSGCVPIPSVTNFSQV